MAKKLEFMFGVKDDGTLRMPHRIMSGKNEIAQANFSREELKLFMAGLSTVECKNNYYKLVSSAGKVENEGALAIRTYSEHGYSHAP